MALQNTFKETMDSLELIYYWYEPYHKIGCIFLIVWDFFSLTLLSPVIMQVLKGGVTFPKNLYALCSFLVLVPAPTYWMLLFVMNKTKINLSRSKITVTNGPLPSLRRSQNILLYNIRHISITKHRTNALFDSTWHMKTDETCSVTAIMKNRESIHLFQNMQNLHEAQIVSSRIKLWMKNKKVR